MTTVCSNVVCNIAFLFPPEEGVSKSRKDPRSTAPCIIREATETECRPYITARRYGRSPRKMFPVIVCCPARGLGPHELGLFKNPFSVHAQSSTGNVTSCGYVKMCFVTSCLAFGTPARFRETLPTKQSRSAKVIYQVII